MKNQYFGDRNDYRKYGLLRLLSGHGQINTAVCWMLTRDSKLADGGRIQYLDKPEKWRSLDPRLYDFLQKCVQKRRIRNVRALERSNILSGCRFYSEIIPDDRNHREQYFQRFLDIARGAKLVFFDPDNGMEVKSVPLGRKHSSKYLYWSEVEASFSAGHSILVYQHWPHKLHEQFTRDLAREFSARTLTNCVYSYHTAQVVFFLVPQSAHEELFDHQNKKVVEVWKGQIGAEKHLIP